MYAASNACWQRCAAAASFSAAFAVGAFVCLRLVRFRACFVASKTSCDGKTEWPGLWRGAAAAVKLTLSSPHFSKWNSLFA